MNPIFDSEDTNSRMMQYLKPYLEKGLITSIDVKHSQNGSPLEVCVKLIVPMEYVELKVVSNKDTSKENYERAMGVIK